MRGESVLGISADEAGDQSDRSAQSRPALLALLAPSDTLIALAHDLRPHTATRTQPMLTPSTVYTSLSRIARGQRPSPRIARALTAARPEWRLTLDDWMRD